jgi:hypothetical protein
MTILLLLVMLSMIPLMFIIVVMGLMIVISAPSQSGSDKHGCEQCHLQHLGNFPRNFLNWLDVS